MVAAPPDGGFRWTASGWIRLDYGNAVRAPETFGAVLLANGREEPLLITHGVIRQELWRLLRDPLAQAHGAVLFRYVETMFESKAEKLAQEMYDRWALLRKSRVFWMHFPPPEGVSSRVAEADPSGSGPR